MSSSGDVRAFFDGGSSVVSTAEGGFTGSGVAAICACCRALRAAKALTGAIKFQSVNGHRGNWGENQEGYTSRLLLLGLSLHSASTLGPVETIVCGENEVFRATPNLRQRSIPRD